MLLPCESRLLAPEAAGEVGATVDAELSVEVAHVGLHGIGRDDELLGDLRRRTPFHEEAQHVLFAAGEVIGAGGLGAEGLDVGLFCRFRVSQLRVSVGAVLCRPSFCG